MYMKDNCFWKVLAVSGIDVCGDSSKLLKCISKSTALIFHLLFSYTFSCGLYVSYKLSSKQLVMAYLILPVFSLLLWHLIFKRRKILNFIIYQIYRQHKLHGISSDKGSMVINVAAIAIFVFPTSLAVVAIIMTTYEPTASNYWTYGYKIEDPIINKLIIMVDNFGYIVFYVYIPCLATLLFCTISYRCGKVLDLFRKKLETCFTSKDITGAIDMMKIYLSFTNALKDVRKTFSVPLIVVVMCNFVSLFTSLVTLLLNDVNKTITLAEVVVNTTSATLMIISQAMSGSIVPSGMEAIKETTNKYATKFGEYPKNKERILFFMHRTEKFEIISMTAWDLIIIDRSFIFYACGSLLTYGLLIINIRGTTE